MNPPCKLERRLLRRIDAKKRKHDAAISRYPDNLLPDERREVARQVVVTLSQSAPPEQRWPDPLPPPQSP